MKQHLLLLYSLWKDFEVVKILTNSKKKTEPRLGRKYGPALRLWHHWEGHSSYTLPLGPIRMMMKRRKKEKQQQNKSFTHTWPVANFHLPIESLPLVSCTLAPTDSAVIWLEMEADWLSTEVRPQRLREMTFDFLSLDLKVRGDNYITAVWKKDISFSIIRQNLSSCHSNN